ncbi:uncharacterized protein [Physcomitrium patens]|uniref:uncharacterized protein isoform X2 n=1 Tax=Physcomitrium patens TaxID=3218 RepID=UPI000D1649EC|nr:uncharacterized protein LOC112290494 isoform X2 [Physcomitrium patens]|eukprot:XP_024392545.1 uncharacterized protein LOC112290494 isoform X2 [Physcomitrella patens]
MVKDFDKYNQRIEDALVANDKRIKKEEEARKALKNAKVVTKPPDDSNVVRSEQPVRVEDAKLANYMHDDRNKDGYVRPYIAWRYLLKQIGLSVTDIVADPRPENERAYPLLNCERHGHDIWKHQTQHNVTHQSPSTVTPGHLNFMYSKMARLLKSELLIVRQKSVTWCVELLMVPENRARCVAAGLLPILAEMIPETDLYIRQQLALCFKYFSAQITTWTDLVELGCIKGLVEMIQTDDVVLRSNALNALLYCALSCEVRDSIVEDGCLAAIVDFIGKDTNSANVCHAIDLCSRCMGSLNYCQKAIDQILAVEGVPTVMKLAKTVDQATMVSCGRFICMIGFEEKGRKQAVALGAVAVFVSYLDHCEARIMACGTAALLSLTLEISGKKEFIMANGVPLCTAMLHLSDGELTLLTVNLVMNVTEDPAARAKLQLGIQICRILILQSFNGNLKHTARRTIQQLGFSSRPFQNLQFVR